MVARPGKYQPRMTAGELDPVMQGNTDEEIYHTGAAYMANFRPLPQGGFTVCDGLQQICRARNLLAQVIGSGAANLIDNNPATFVTLTGLGVTLAEVGRVTFSVLTSLSAVDLLSFAATLPGGAAPTMTPPSPPLSPQVNGTVIVQYLNAASAWVQLDAAQPLTDTLRTMRFALDPGQTFQASAVRMMASSTTAGGVTVYVGDMPCFVETATPSPLRIRAFAQSVTTAYDFCFTAGNVEIIGAAGRVASLPSPWNTSQIALLKQAQELDTMIVFHGSTPPQLIQRQGGDAFWTIQNCPMNNLPNYDFGDVEYTNGIAAQWTLQFFNFDTELAAGTPVVPAGGVHYKVTVNGTDSAAIQQPAYNYAGTAAALQALISSVPGVNPGVTVVQQGSTSTTNQSNPYLVTFAGVANLGNQWAIAGAAIDKSDAAITAAQLTVGVPGGEPIYSAARGWPACGIFAQERLMMAGSPSTPNSILCSETGNYFDFDTRMQASTAPMLLTLDMQGSDAIVAMHQGRTLYVFTQHSEFWFEPAQISRTVPPVIVFASDNGLAPGVQPVENEGASLYVQKNGGTLFEFVFDYALQNYRSNNISAPSAALINGVIDCSKRPLVANTDANHLWLVLASGQATLVSLLRMQQITAFSRRITDGQFLCVNVNARFDVTFGVSRLVGGHVVQFIERGVAGLWLDQAQYVTLGTPGTSVTGLTDYEGASVWVVADGIPQGPFVVTNGTLTMNFAGQNLIVGRWIAPDVITLPQPRDIAPNTVLRRPARVHTLRTSLVNSTSLALGANGQPCANVALGRYDQSLVDQPPTPYSGEALRYGLLGYSMTAQAEITQLSPGALTVNGITVEADL